MSIIKDWEGTKVRGPRGVVYVRGNNPTKISTKWFVEDEDRISLFETEKSADIAIQWAIDFQSSKESANNE